MSSECTHLVPAQHLWLPKWATTRRKHSIVGAYNLVCARDGDELKAAFWMHYSHFEYLVIPFALINAPVTFQYFINDILKATLDRYVVAYPDSILIFFRHCWTKHHAHPFHPEEAISTWFCAKVEKCAFDQSSIEFLGSILSPSVIKMDPCKLKAVLRWEVP